MRCQNIYLFENFRSAHKVKNELLHDIAISHTYIIFTNLFIEYYCHRLFTRQKLEITKLHQKSKDALINIYAFTRIITNNERGNVQIM